MKEKPEVKNNPSLLPKHKYLVCQMQAGPWVVVAADAGLWEAHQKMLGLQVANRKETYKVMYIEDIKFV